MPFIIKYILILPSKQALIHQTSRQTKLDSSKSDNEFNLLSLKKCVYLHDRDHTELNLLQQAMSLTISQKLHLHNHIAHDPQLKTKLLIKSKTGTTPYLDSIAVEIFLNN